MAIALLLAGPARAQSAAWQWGLQSGNATPYDATNAISYALAVDSQGRSYVGGAYGENYGTGIPATRGFGSAGSVGPGQGGFVACATAAGQWAWVASVVVPGSTGTTGYPGTKVTGVAVTATGDVYATGYAMGSTVQVGALTQSFSPLSMGIFVARFNSAGVCQWVRAVGTTMTRPSIAADPSTGGVVIAGDYLQPFMLGNYTVPGTVSFNTKSLFVGRLSAAGQWLGAVGATGSGSIASDVQVAVGPDGQVAVTGSYSAGSLTFGAQTLTAPASTVEALLVAQLSPANQWDWAAGPSNTSVQRSAGTSVAYTSSGALWVSGRGSNGTVLGANTPLVAFGTPASAYAGFVAQLSPFGQWGIMGQLSPGGDALGSFSGLAVDGADNAVAIGVLESYAGPIQADLGSLLLVAPTNDRLFFVAQLNTTGQWSYTATVPAPSRHHQLGFSYGGLDAAGNYYLAGFLRGGLNIGNSSLLGTDDGTTNFNGQGDAILAKLSAVGTPLASRPASANINLVCLPNPAHQQATLHWATPGGEAAIIKLTNMLGQTVRQFSIPAHATSANLNLLGLPAGVYQVQYGTASSRLVVN